MGGLTTPATQSTPRVLVAEPDAQIRHFYTQSLTATGCDVIEAADGREALVRALVREPSLVVAELHLPLIDGVSLCRILREDRVTRDVPILILTSDTDRANVSRALFAGADQVLAKPATIDVLLLETRRLLSASAELRRRAHALRNKVAQQLEHSTALIERSAGHRPIKSHVHDRRATTTPPLAPPALKCPTCDVNLRYDHSEIGGVSATHPEQWDYFECASCGLFQYRQRTRKLRRVG
jgi:DNA-binding response OmpR family regulator